MMNYLIGLVESNARLIAKRMLGSRGHASASQRKRIPTDADGAAAAALKVAGFVADEGDACPAFDGAPRSPAAGASSASNLNEKVQTGPLSLGYRITLQSVESSLVPTKNSCEVWVEIAALQITVFGIPRCLHIGSRGEWKNEVLAHLCSVRSIRLQFPGEGAHPWMLERRNGLARCIKNRLRYGGRFAGRVILNEAQYCLNAMLNLGWSSAYRVAFG